MLSSLLEGLRYVRGTPVTRTVIMLAATASLFARSAHTLMPVFARDILAAGAQGLGFLLSAPGAGTIVASLALAAYGEIAHKGRYYVVANLIFCACLAAFTVSRLLPVSLALLFAAGGFVSTAGTTAVTLLQQNTPPHLRGRVLSLITLSLIGLPSVGGMVLGSAAIAVGSPAAVLMGVVVVATAMLGLGVPILWRALPYAPQRA